MSSFFRTEKASGPKSKLLNLRIKLVIRQLVPQTALAEIGKMPVFNCLYIKGLRRPCLELVEFSSRSSIAGQGVLPAVRDPRLSEAGNCLRRLVRCAKNAGRPIFLGDVTAKMFACRATRG